MVRCGFARAKLRNVAFHGDLPVAFLELWRAVRDFRPNPNVPDGARRAIGQGGPHRGPEGRRAIVTETIALAPSISAAFAL